MVHQVNWILVLHSMINKKKVTSYKPSQQIKPRLELIFGLPRILTIIASNVLKKHTPQSQPRFYIAS